MNMKNLSRRTLLRGAGAAVALPWLESLTPAFAQSAKPPVRLGFFYVPNGVHMPNWRPAEAGDLKELPAILKSLEPVKNKVLVLSDLAADHCQNSVAAHEPSGGGLVEVARVDPASVVTMRVAGPMLYAVMAGGGLHLVGYRLADGAQRWSVPLTVGGAARRLSESGR